MHLQRGPAHFSSYEMFYADECGTCYSSRVSGTCQTTRSMIRKQGENPLLTWLALPLALQIIYGGDSETSSGNIGYPHNFSFYPAFSGECLRTVVHPSLLLFTKHECNLWRCCTHATTPLTHAKQRKLKLVPGA